MNLLTDTNFHSIAVVKHYGKSSIWLDGDYTFVPTTVQERREYTKDLIRQFKQIPKLKKILLKEPLIATIRQTRTTPLATEWNINPKDLSKFTIDFWVNH